MGVLHTSPKITSTCSDCCFQCLPADSEHIAGLVTVLIRIFRGESGIGVGLIENYKAIRVRVCRINLRFWYFEYHVL